MRIQAFAAQPDWPQLSDGVQYIIVYELIRTGLSFTQAVRQLHLTRPETTLLIDMIVRHRAETETHNKAMAVIMASNDLSLLDNLPRRSLATDSISKRAIRHGQSFLTFMKIPEIAFRLDSYEGVALHQEYDIPINHFIEDEDENWEDLPPHFGAAFPDKLRAAEDTAEEDRVRAAKPVVPRVPMDAPAGTVNPKRLDPSGYLERGKVPMWRKHDVAPGDLEPGQLDPYNYDIGRIHVDLVQSSGEGRVGLSRIATSVQIGGHMATLEPSQHQDPKQNAITRSSVPRSPAQRDAGSRELVSSAETHLAHHESASVPGHTALARPPRASPIPIQPSASAVGSGLSLAPPRGGLLVPPLLQPPPVAMFSSGPGYVLPGPNNARPTEPAASRPTVNNDSLPRDPTPSVRLRSPSLADPMSTLPAQTRGPADETAAQEHDMSHSQLGGQGSGEIGRAPVVPASLCQTQTMETSAENEDDNHVDGQKLISAATTKQSTLVCSRTKPATTRQDAVSGKGVTENQAGGSTNAPVATARLHSAVNNAAREGIEPAPDDGRGMSATELGQDPAHRGAASDFTLDGQEEDWLAEFRAAVEAKRKAWRKKTMPFSESRQARKQARQRFEAARPRRSETRHAPIGGIMGSKGTGLSLRKRAREAIFREPRLKTGLAEPGTNSIAGTLGLGDHNKANRPNPSIEIAHSRSATNPSSMFSLYKPGPVHAMKGGVLHSVEEELGGIGKAGHENQGGGAASIEEPREQQNNGGAARPGVGASGHLRPVSIVDAMESEQGKDQTKQARKESLLTGLSFPTAAPARPAPPAASLAALFPPTSQVPLHLNPPHTNNFPEHLSCSGPSSNLTTGIIPAHPSSDLSSFPSSSIPPHPALLLKEVPGTKPSAAERHSKRPRLLQSTGSQPGKTTPQTLASFTTPPSGTSPVLPLPIPLPLLLPPYTPPYSPSTLFSSHTTSFNQGFASNPAYHPASCPPFVSPRHHQELPTDPPLVIQPAQVPPLSELSSSPGFPSRFTQRSGQKEPDSISGQNKKLLHNTPTADDSGDLTRRFETPISTVDPVFTRPSLETEGFGAPSTRIGSCMKRSFIYSQDQEINNSLSSSTITNMANRQGNEGRGFGHDHAAPTQVDEARANVYIPVTPTTSNANQGIQTTGTQGNPNEPDQHYLDPAQVQTEFPRLQKRWPNTPFPPCSIMKKPV